jgi:hypothetical protein
LKKKNEQPVKPLSADEIHQDSPGLYQLKNLDMVRLLQREAVSGAIHLWSAGPGSRKTSFYRQDETSYFQVRIKSALTRQVLTKTDLLENIKKDAVPCSKARLTSIVNTTLTALIKEKTL